MQIIVEFYAKSFGGLHMQASETINENLSALQIGLQWLVLDLNFSCRQNVDSSDFTYKTSVFNTAPVSTLCYNSNKINSTKYKSNKMLIL